MNIQLFHKAFLPGAHSDHAAIITRDKIISYDELSSEIKAYTAWLKSMGVKEGSHAAILCENNSDFIFLLFALWQLNAVAIPLNTRLLDEEIDRLITHSESEIVFVHSNLKERLHRKKYIFPDEAPNSKEITISKVTGSTDEFEINNYDTDNTAVILYTSGTTGNPKGVMLSYKNLYQSALAADTIIRHTSSDRWLCSLPFYHIGGLSIPVRAVIFGTALALPDSLKTEDIRSSLENLKPSLVSFVSATLKRLIESDYIPHESLRIVLLGGGPIENDLAKEALLKKWPLVKVYGSTETSSLVTAVSLPKHPDKLSTAGKPLGNNEVVITDDNKQIKDVNKSGEILISAGSVMKGYWKNPSETQLKLAGKYFYTGDLGYLDEEGYLHIEARRTDLIISGGENINPLEVEEALLKFPGIKEACVFPLPDKEWGQIVVSAIVTENEPISPEEIKMFLRQTISSYKIPRRFFFTGSLPRTDLGKIKREAVRDLFT